MKVEVSLGTMGDIARSLIMTRNEDMLSISLKGWAWDSVGRTTIENVTELYSGPTGTLLLSAFGTGTLVIGLSESDRRIGEFKFYGDDQEVEKMVDVRMAAQGIGIRTVSKL